MHWSQTDRRYLGTALVDGLDDLGLLEEAKTILLIPVEEDTVDDSVLEHDTKDPLEWIDRVLANDDASFQLLQILVNAKDDSRPPLVPKLVHDKSLFDYWYDIAKGLPDWILANDSPNADGRIPSWKSLTIETRYEVLFVIMTQAQQAALLRQQRSTTKSRPTSNTLSASDPLLGENKDPLQWLTSMGYDMSSSLTIAQQQLLKDCTLALQKDYQRRKDVLRQRLALLHASLGYDYAAETDWNLSTIANDDQEIRDISDWIQHFSIPQHRSGLGRPTPRSDSANPNAHSDLSDLSSDSPSALELPVGRHGFIGDFDKPEQRMEMPLWSDEPRKEATTEGQPPKSNHKKTYSKHKSKPPTSQGPGAKG